MNWSLYLEWLPQLAVAAGGTLKMTAFAFCFALVLGLAIALARISRNRALSRAALVYIEVIRGTPLLTQLLIIYFGGASLGINLPAFQAAVLGLGLNGAAYLAEVYRSGIQAVHRGQLEAAQSIGMPRSMALRFIVFPQAIPIVLPPIANYSISLLRETSIASLIAAPELMIKRASSPPNTSCPCRLTSSPGSCICSCRTRWRRGPLSRNPTGAQALTKEIHLSTTSLAPSTPTDGNPFAADFSTDPYWWMEAPRPSLPEAAVPDRADVVVVGSGFTGLSASLTLARGVAK
jgi:polar amino acid transport system permease protein